MSDSEITALLGRFAHKKVVNKLLGDTEWQGGIHLFEDARPTYAGTEEQYKAAVLELRHRGLIEIDLNGRQDYERAVVRVTDAGVEWMKDHLREDF